MRVSTPITSNPLSQHNDYVVTGVLLVLNIPFFCRHGSVFGNGQISPVSEIGCLSSGGSPDNHRIKKDCKVKTTYRTYWNMQRLKAGFGFPASIHVDTCICPSSASPRRCKVCTMPWNLPWLDLRWLVSSLRAYPLSHP